MEHLETIDVKSDFGKERVKLLCQRAIAMPIHRDNLKIEKFMVTLDFVESEALQLPTDQRLALVQRILTSVEPLFSVDVEAA